MKTQGWEARLTAYNSKIKAMPFTPSEIDCGMYSANAIIAMTGIDYAGHLRGKYRTLERGFALLRRKGFDDHVAMAASIFEEYPSPLLAQRGDLVAVEQGDATALGIVQGEYVYVMTLTGLGLVPITQAVRAFKI